MSNNNNAFNHQDLAQEVSQLSASAHALTVSLYSAVPSRNQRESLTRQAESIAEGLAQLNQEITSIVTQLDQVERLIHTSQLINSSLEIEAVLDEVLDSIIQLADAERAIILLRKEGTNEIVVEAARDFLRQTLDKHALPISQSIIQATINNKEPILTIDAQADERFQGKDSVVFNELRSVMVFPMLVNEKVMGVMYIDNRSARGVFNKDMFPILSAFANQAAMAITNARQYTKVRGYLQETQSELLRLSIEIDQTSVAAKVDQITNTAIFERLQKFSRETKTAATRPTIELHSKDASKGDKDDTILYYRPYIPPQEGRS